MTAFEIVMLIVAVLMVIGFFAIINDMDSIKKILKDFHKEKYPDSHQDSTSKE